MVTLDSLRENAAWLWSNVAEGWRHLWNSAAGALTRFTPGDKTTLPAEGEVDDGTFHGGQTWSVLGGDIFEDDDRIVVRLEVPGVDKQDINVELVHGELVISGEKRFEKEETQGRWRTLQCAYGSFRRVVALPATVQPDAARASYRNGVLRVELAKEQPARPAGKSIPIQ